MEQLSKVCKKISKVETTKALFEIVTNRKSVLEIHNENLHDDENCFLVSEQSICSTCKAINICSTGKANKIMLASECTFC